jgi:hypothetical protein
MAVTLDDVEKYDRNYFQNPPKDFADLSSDERRAWVEQELATGDYAVAKSLPFQLVLSFGATSHEWRPEYYMYLILLSAIDPEQTAPHIRGAVRAVFFILAYELERATPHVSTDLWLKAMSECPFTPEEMKARDMIKLLLKSRGAEAVLPFVKDGENGAHFVEIFGVKSLTLLPADLANQVKGKHLSDELGL